MVGVKADSGAAALVGRLRHFVVNVLAADQLDIGKVFFRSTSVEGGLINGHAFEDGPATGVRDAEAVPLLLRDTGMN